VIGVREAPWSCSESDSIAEAIERRPAGAPTRKREPDGLAQCAGACWRKKASSRRAPPGQEEMPKGPHGLVFGPETGNWVLDGERHSDSRRSLALARGRTEAKKASDSETGRSRQRVSEVLRQLRTWSTTPRRGGESPTQGYDRTDRSSSRGVNRRGTRAERAARRERRSLSAERPGSDEARRKPRIRELGEFRVLVKEVSCRSRWKHLLRARSA
jgi:hypothetical protein